MCSFEGGKCELFALPCVVTDMRNRNSNGGKEERRKLKPKRKDKSRERKGRKGRQRRKNIWKGGNNRRKRTFW
jgi:hypothetical protein